MNLYRFVPAFALLLPLSAAAGPREAALDALSRCAALGDDRARLACYDGVASQLKDVLSAPPPAPVASPVMPAAPVAAPTPQQEEHVFGFDGGLFGDTQLTPEERANGVTPEAVDANRLDSITSDLTDYSLNQAGRFVVFLANGQVWRQISGDDNIARLPKTTDKIAVTIERGFVGSFSMHFSNQTGTYKVTRLK